MVEHILFSAENSLKALSKIFNYIPTEKIVISTYDINDYGYAAATSVPENFIRLEIEPFEPGYENILYNERFQWVLSHELVHIVVNDMSTNYENAFRTVFKKVEPDQKQPISVLYSLLTNYGRYTPRWHQEGIAVFMETWLSGGFGRTLSNFDEMYFRTMTVDNKEFPNNVSLDAIYTHNSFLLESLFYLYGTRFTSYLAIKYGAEKLLNWYKADPTDFYGGFKSKFSNVFNSDFDKEWENFINEEKEFQSKNISRIKQSDLTPIYRIKAKPTGWVTEPYFDKKNNSIIFGYHRPHHLAGIKKLNLSDSSYEELTSLPTPSIHQVASTAYDSEFGLFFYTTNNNQFYRDIRVLDINSGKEKILFEDYRIGSLTVSSSTHELWGIQHTGGNAILVYSAYPYHKVEPVIKFNLGDDLQDLSISPSGKNLAAVLHKTNGEQYLILASADSLKAGNPFKFQTIYNEGSPESPSWSSDGKYLFWSAYTNGVSNIYRKNINNDTIKVLSNNLRGLFKPIYLNDDSLFAFEFTTEGFVPVIIPNLPHRSLHAIEYLGQKIIQKNPDVTNWILTSPDTTINISEREDYNGFANLKLQAFIPVISGFQSEKVLGIYSHIIDPLFHHDLKLEMGFTIFKNNPASPDFHFKGVYSYKHKWDFGLDINAPDFYDLFNSRKRGMIGTKIRVTNNHYWIFDNPEKLVQNSEIAYYTNVEFINDNLVRVSEPDFMVAQTNFNFKNLRRSIGSSDFEKGINLKGVVMVFGSDPNDAQFAAQTYFEFDNYNPWIFNHNILHLKLAAGYHNTNDRLFQARFFFGGFGNRGVENENVKQYRKVFRFPGIPIYSLDATRFLKVMVENSIPPIRFSNFSLSQHYLSHIDISFYSQSLWVKSSQANLWVDLGAQINLLFKHWFNLESTLSAGIAKAWYNGGNNWEWFVSYKILKN